MFEYAARRVLLLIPILLIITFLVTLMLDLIPGDPVDLILGEEAPVAAAEALRASLGLDKPLHLRYVNYVVNLLRGDMGRSIRTREPMGGMIRRALFNTLKLAVVALSLTILIAVPLGIVAAIRPNSAIDNISRLISLLGVSMPIFWTGIIAIWLFAYTFRLVPTGGTGTWLHLVLPGVTLAGPGIAVVTRMTRASLLEVMREDYIRTARSKGLSERVVLFKHALRNSLIPVSTVLGLDLGRKLGGSVLTETVFAWPGIGRMLLSGIFGRDIPVVQNGVLVVAVCFVIVNLIVDLFYAVLDPRIRYS